MWQQVSLSDTVRHQSRTWWLQYHLHLLDLAFSNSTNGVKHFIVNMSKLISRHPFLKLSLLIINGQITNKELDSSSSSKLLLTFSPRYNLYLTVSLLNQYERLVQVRHV